MEPVWRRASATVGSLVATVLAVSLAISPAAADNPSLCGYGTTYSHGTIGDDVGDFYPFEDGQCWWARAGNDSFNAGNQGYNLAFGGPGSDALNGHFGNDSLNGGPNTDTLTGGTSKDYLYGGGGSDYIDGGPSGPGSSDDLFGGGFCRETGYYGFVEGSGGGGNTPDLPCSNDLGDTIKGGPGIDYIWESNSDRVGDGHVDIIDGGDHKDVCIVESIDVVSNCETIITIALGS